MNISGLVVLAVGVAAYVKLVINSHSKQTQKSYQKDQIEQFLVLAKELH